MPHRECSSIILKPINKNKNEPKCFSLTKTQLLTSPNLNFNINKTNNFANMAWFGLWGGKSNPKPEDKPTTEVNMHKKT